MHEPSPSRTRSVAGVLVTVIEGLELSMEAAFAAAAMEAADIVPQRLGIDFCTDGEGFQAEVRGRAPKVLVFPYTGEFGEIIAHVSGAAAAASSGEVWVVGDGLARDPAPPTFGAGVRTWSGDLGPSFREIREGVTEVWGPATALAPSYGPFGGADVPTRPMVGSLFWEFGAVGCVASRGQRADLSPTALLARLEAPLPEPAVIETEALAEAVDGLGAGHTLLEWWDRNPPDEILETLRALHVPRRRQSVRVLPRRRDRGWVRELARAGASRLVFECDACTGSQELPGASATVEELEPWFDAARSEGLEVGVLLVVGVPGETRAAGERRLAALRRLGPDRLRAVPFEPTWGHAARKVLVDAGALGDGRRRWNRELFRPLEGVGFSSEEFVLNWSDAMMLLAEIGADLSGAR